MTLIESYVTAVGDRLGSARRASVEAELRSSILDALEARGATADSEEDVVAVLSQLGSPARVAAGYEPRRGFLVGPELFPWLLKVAGVALGVVLLGGGLFYATSLLLGGLADFRAGALLAQALALALRALVVGAVVMVAVFAWLQRAEVAVPSVDGDAAWDPRSLRRRAAGPRTSRFESATTVVASAVALILLDGVGITARSLAAAGPPGLQALAGEVVVAAYALQVATLLAITAHVGVLVRGRDLPWTRVLRFAGTGIALVVFAIAPFRLLAFGSALREAGASTNVVNWLTANAFIVAVVALGIAVVGWRRRVAAQQPGASATLRTVMLLLVVVAAGCTAAASPVQVHDALPAPSPSRIVSPELHADGRVTFRVQAPSADAVAVVLESAAPVGMSQANEGIWVHTTEPLAPDIYAYHVMIDGQAAFDRNNADGAPMVTGGRHSYVVVPAADAQLWEKQDVPAGAMRRHEYASARFGETRDVWVYTPPGYDDVVGHHYPVLVLLHGVMSDARSWSTIGRADVILDNMIAAGLAQPMIVVMPLGYGLADARTRAPEMLAPTTDQRAVMNEFAAGLMEEVLPFVERQYRTRTDAAGRAVAGFSMGGSQALAIGLNRPAIFATVASFSGAFIMFGFQYDPWFGEIAPVRRQRIAISVGADDFLLPVNQHLTTWLRERGLAFSFDVVPGAHSMQVGRRDLIRLLPSLFRGDER